MDPGVKTANTLTRKSTMVRQLIMAFNMLDRYFIGVGMLLVVCSMTSLLGILR